MSKDWNLNTRRRDDKHKHLKTKRVPLCYKIITADDESKWADA
jgi:hypothetical protein